MGSESNSLAWLLRSSSRCRPSETRLQLCVPGYAVANVVTSQLAFWYRHARTLAVLD